MSTTPPSSECRSSSSGPPAPATSGRRPRLGRRGHASSRRRCARGRPASWDELEPQILAEYAPNPSGRLGTEDDIAAAAAFLASPLAGYINGIDLRVDGGITSVA
ncbi:SDR family oxidoreductase [Actinomadura bangladeshensis]